MAGQARAAASRNGSGDGLAMIRKAPTAIVSEPAVARTRSRLSATSASRCASRHVLSRLSARLRNRSSSESWPRSGDASSAAAHTTPRTLDIHQHPASREDGEWSGTDCQHSLRGAEYVDIDVGDAGYDLHEDDCRNRAEDNARRAPRPRGHGKKHGVGHEYGEREANRQRDGI